MPDDFKVFVDFALSVPIIHIEGEITSEADEEILGKYESIPQEKRDRVILNFQGTSYINSAGIATLISLITKASETKKKVEFAGLNEHFRKVMDIVGLADFVLIHNSLQEALK
ncbi:STAS domain-containing protein [Leptospira borgpetersenii serovar Hardjo-bovis]|uniref:STAS domain protein n=1 Tax=Leptospira borgpetersenii serovar Hardjo-bovis str. Sponselee TaxID=1303729 RepID=M6BWA2_LEPBO|nr:STAS domain-containing protein [Leptospira borgpetersenii]ABJ80078.1 Anti-sigma factor antagonist [Leptospira borgpetersenii serovar Hardjo-bovis str. L550]AMX59520.1 anti-sigma factor antagonist [Leptospira borgpetersenii serovar Hardjo]AMX62748.1 anti-sigma factor antagonist [Leptospira borgpetersenii serovar Hardjo]AMX65991.1 anti-sigma factor antagonist [Leptospira borgpetersenii serovar Hardjo]AMX69224.1 anti-sigma factor antagonist [Leptospira borgpetersenii serovar Hardjo]